MSPALLFVIFVICLFASIPVSGSMAIASLAPGLMGVDSITAISFIRNCVEGVNSFSLLAIPMFILSGIVMARGGVSRKLFDFFTYFIGKIPGGMPCAVIVTCLFYGAISGSAPATVAAVGSMTIPILLNLGYTREFTVSTVCVAGSLGVIIPPSIPMVLYCMANSEASVGKMFTAGILPGFLIAGCLMVYAVFYCLRHGEDKERINKEVSTLRQRGFVKVFFTSFWALLSPVIILGSIYGGIASPTEAATISVFYALIVGLFIYRTLKVKDIPAILQETVQTYGPLLFVLGAAAAFAKVMAMLQIPAMVSDFMIATFHSKFMILLIVNIFLFFVGMVMDGGPAILLLTPILWPIVKAVGINEIHFGIMMIVNLAIGFVTPPIGINLFVASRVGELPVMTVAKNVMPYICLFVVALVAIISFPGISLTLVGGSASGTVQTASGGAEGVEAIEAEYSTDNLEKLDIAADNIGEYNWFLGTDSSEDTVTQLYAQKFAELVNYYSDGKMTITVQANGTLGSDNALCESVKTQDGVNFVVQTTAPEVNFIPELAVFDAACVYGDISEVRMALDDAEFMETINGLYANGGYKLLGFADQNFRELSTNVEVSTMADLKGQKIRTMENDNHLKFWSSCGANPTPMAFSEVYTSLQNGTIDGQENPYEVIVGNKLYEVQKYVVTTNHLPHILALITGNGLYDSLNDDEKAVIDAAVDKAKAYARKQADARAGERIEAIEAGGSTVLPFNQSLFTEMQEAAQDEWDQIKGICGEDLFNAYTQYMGQGGSGVVYAAPEVNLDNIGEYSWFLGTDSSEDTVTQLYAVKFSELVNEYSGGKMNIVVQANGTLGSDNALCESVKAQDGVNFVVQTTAPEVNFIPELAVFDAACVYGDIADVRTALDDDTFMNTINGLYEKSGYKLLGFADQNFRELSTNVEVSTLADLKGQKIRTMENDNHLKFWSSCGANPTPMAFSEVYTSLQNGTIDGQENPYEVIVGNKLYEVQKYVVTTNHLPHILALITGADMYNNLNDDEKAVIDAAVMQAKAYAREQADSRAGDRIAAIEAGGSTVLPFNADLFAEMQAAAQDEWEQIKGVCGEDLFNAYTKYMVNINTENVGEYQWFLGTDSSEDTVTQLYAQRFAELVNQYSDGKMNIVIQANGTLGSDNALCESVKAQDGVNFVVQTTAPEVNFIPQLAVFDTACVYSDINDVRNALDDMEFMNTVSGLYESAGYKLMGFADQNFRELSTNVEVKTLADLKGQKIRTMENDNHLKFWSGCGANPTPMAFSEVYTSLQNGTIDGQENPYEVIVGNKLYEVQKYVVTTNHLPHILALITGADMYNNQNDDEKAVLDAAVLRAKAYAREQADSRAAARIAAIEAGGSTVLPLNPDLFAEMQEAAQAEWDQIRAAVGDELFNAYTQQ